MNGLEALKKLFFDNKDLHVDIVLNDRNVCKIYNTIKQDLERLEKLEKVIKILKDKKVSIELLLKTNALNQYNRVRHLYDASDYLTAEEYELLKEVLENE